MELFGKLEDRFKDIPSGVATIVFADLPYLTTNCNWDTPIDLNVFWEECWRVLKTNGVVICTAQVPFNIMLGQSQLRYLKYEWIWEKTSATGALNAKKMPMKAHENVMVFYKKTPDYYPIKTQGHKRKVSSVTHKRNSLKSSVYNEYEPTDYDSTERYPRSVQKFPTDKQRLAIHETQKPEALLNFIIRTYSKEGDTVIDPCRGSNTTGVVCDKLGRKYYGIEKDEYHFRMGILRRQNPEFRTKELKTLYKYTNPPQ